MRKLCQLLSVLFFIYWGCEEEQKKEKDTIYGTWELLERNMTKADLPQWDLYEQFYNKR